METEQVLKERVDSGGGVDPRSRQRYEKNVGGGWGGTSVKMMGSSSTGRRIIKTEAQSGHNQAKG